MADYRVQCDGVRHLVLTDVYSGGLWSQSTLYPCRTDVVDVAPCDCRKVSDPQETMNP